mmetsp:Transcript_35749/g.87992  ORF Transcript_35749/g.87992 Transcript_35749/m.87992 type:complete len:309 (+) Transcript_35749:84-1010(+)
MRRRRRRGRAAADLLDILHRQHIMGVEVSASELHHPAVHGHCDHGAEPRVLGLPQPLVAPGGEAGDFLVPLVVAGVAHAARHAEAHDPAGEHAEGGLDEQVQPVLAAAAAFSAVAAAAAAAVCAAARRQLRRREVGVAVVRPGAAAVHAVVVDADVAVGDHQHRLVVLVHLACRDELPKDAVLEPLHLAHEAHLVADAAARAAAAAAAADAATAAHHGARPARRPRQLGPDHLRALAAVRVLPHRVNGVRREDGERVHAGARDVEQEQEEGLVVAVPHAVVDPHAVVVHAQHAAVAHPAVVRARGLVP